MLLSGNTVPPGGHMWLPSGTVRLPGGTVKWILRLSRGTPDRGWWRPAHEVLRRDVGAGKGVIRKFREKPFRRCAALDVEAAVLLGYDKAALFEVMKSAVCGIAANVQGGGGFSNAVWDFPVVGI